jgi:protein gp37
MFTTDVATNLVALVVTLVAGVEKCMDVAVSITFAVKYVEKYSANTRIKGFETKNLCGAV